MSILAEHETLSKAEKGTLLRREGLYSSLLTEWRRELLGRALARWLVHGSILASKVWSPRGSQAGWELTGKMYLSTTERS